MIIGFDGSKAFKLNKTGVENYSYQLLYHLSKIDHNNTYLVYLDPRVNQISQNWPENFQFKTLNWPIMWTQLGLAWQTYLDSLDLLFITAHTLPLLKNPFLKSLITVHDLGAEYLGSLHQIKQRLYLGLMTRIQLKFASKIIAVSQATKKDLELKVGIESKKIEVVYEGVNDQAKSESKININKQFDIQKGKYFLFVGTIQPRKNLERVIEAYIRVYGTRLDPPKLVLAGEKGWLSESIYQKAHQSPLRDKILFLGRVDDEVLSSLYQKAISLVFPSLFEGFGLPILEAFKYDCPVITSNLSAMPEVAGNAALLVDPYSVDQIAQAMDRVTSDNQLRRSLISKGRQQFKKFSWEKCAHETLTVIEGVKDES